MKPTAKLFLFLLFSSLLGCNEDNPEPDPCELSSPDLTFSIQENSVDGTLLGNAAIESSESAVIGYTITEGNTDNIFTIDASTGDISVSNSEALDYEQIQLLTLTVQAESNDCITGSYKVLVNVLNELDESYVDPFFTSVLKDVFVVYGSANTSDQVMDVYYPADAAGPHPLFVIAGGGRWYPSDLGNFIDMGNRMAKAGYVVAAIRYISDIPDAMNPQERTIIGVQDLRAAIRYFRKSASEDNQYNIDPDNIFLGGFGTGAFLALQTYITEDDISAVDLETVNSYGGFEGENRGNAGFPSSFKAIVAMAGAVYDLNWIDDNEVPVCCVHATGDQEVAFGAGTSRNGLTTYGSSLIIDRATELGLYNKLIAIESNRHDAPMECDECYVEVLKFLKPLLE